MATTLDERGWPHYPHAVWHIDHGRQFYRHLLMALELQDKARKAELVHDKELERQRWQELNLLEKQH